MHTKLINAIKISSLALVLSIGLSYVYAWTAPTATPPAGNVAAPINTSATDQIKSGTLSVGKFKINDVVALNSVCTNKGLIATDISGGQLFCDGTTYKYPFTSPNVHRYSFYNGTGTNTSDTFFCNPTCSWTVPAGVRSGYVTMAGGGSSGSGQRLSNAYFTGSSAGNVQNVPVPFVANETISVTVGKGGKGYNVLKGPHISGPYYVYLLNTTEPDTYYQGTRGYPGTLSNIKSIVNGTLLECSGAGAHGLGVDSFLGVYVPNDGVNLATGAVTGSGSPSLVLPGRPSTGAYGAVSGGRCGPSPVSGYGSGITGIQSWTIGSGSYLGGQTSMGYGSGGGMGISGCHVTSSVVGMCFMPYDGKDGVVYIDVSY